MAGLEERRPVCSVHRYIAGVSGWRSQLRTCRLLIARKYA
jgi:hypothetical protein